MNTINLILSGLTCPACAKLAKRRLEKISGVLAANVEPDGNANIVADRKITSDELQLSLAGSGYTVKQILIS